MGNRERKVIRAEHNDPINFTCGICKQVHEYNSEDPYRCEIYPEIEVNEKVEVEENAPA